MARLGRERREFGWEAGTRTPITRTRTWRVTITLPPSRVTLLVYGKFVGADQAATDRDPSVREEGEGEGCRRQAGEAGWKLIWVEAGSAPSGCGIATVLAWR